MKPVLKVNEIFKLHTQQAVYESECKSRQEAIEALMIGVFTSFSAVVGMAGPEGGKDILRALEEKIPLIVQNTTVVHMQPEDFGELNMYRKPKEEGK